MQLAQASAWVVFGVLFAMGRVVSRVQAEALVALWKQRGDEWRAIAEANAAAAQLAQQNARTVLEGMRTVEALLRSIDTEARQRRQVEQERAPS